MTFIWGLLKPFLPSPMVLLMYGGIALGVLSFFTWFGVHYYNKGWNAAIAAIAEDNQEAVNEANRARTKVRDCRNGGGTWDTVGGVCR